MKKGTINMLTDHATAAVVTLTGVLSLAGWVWGVEFLYRGATSWVTMKPTTAVGLTVLGAGLHGMRFAKFRQFAEFVIIAVVSYMVVSYMVGASAAIEAIDDPVFSSGPGIPSLGTMLALSCSAIAFRVRWVWFVVFAIGIVPLFGYVGVVTFDKPWHALTYYVADWSSAMAFPTATGFCAAGVAGWRAMRKAKA